MAKNIKKEISSTIKWFAAEYSFLKKLHHELKVIEIDENLSNPEKKLKKALRVTDYIGKAESKGERKLNKVKEDLSKLSSVNKEQLSEDIMRIEIPEKDLIKNSSRYIGSIKEGVKNLRLLSKKKNKHPEIKELSEKFEQENRNLTQEIENLEKWLEALELGLKRLSRRKFIKTAGKVAAGVAITSSLGYYGVKKKLFHRISGLFDEFIFSSYEIKKLNEKGVFITIDDGPRIHNDKKDLKMQEENTNFDLNYGKATLQLYVTYFMKRNINPIFFWVGKRLKLALKNTYYRNLLIKAVRQGFIIGNHSYSHKPFSQLGVEEIFDEIRKTDELIDELYKISGVRRPARLIRFPYGDRPKFSDRKEVYKMLNDSRYEIWFWSVDPEDWNPKHKLSDIHTKINSVSDGDILLIHELPKTFSDYLDPICKNIKKKGLRFGVHSSLKK